MQYPLTTTAWTKIASAGATVEVQNLGSTGVQLAIASTPPQPGADGEVLWGGAAGGNIYRKYDAPLPADLYAIAMVAAPTSVEVKPIGAAGGGSGGAAPVTTAVVITPGTPVAPGRKALINCTAAGAMRLKLSSGATFDVALQVGESELDGYTVIDVVAGSTTATATVTVLG